MRKNFIILFSLNLILRILMQGLLPLYPIIAEKLGASKSNNGLLLAASYSMLLLSTWLSGKLIPKITSAKTLLLISLFPLTISLALFGISNNLVFFLLSSLVLFFSAGLNITSNIILITYYSSEKNIGSNFGILGLSNLLGSILGGFIVGPILYKFGNAFAFTVFSLIWLFISSFSFFVDKPYLKVEIEEKKVFRFTKQFSLLLTSVVLITMLVHLFIFSFSLLLKQSGYNIKDISLFSALGSAIALPMPYLFGTWTLKYKPKVLLLIVYCLMFVALLLLLVNKTIPIIIIAVSCMSVLAYAARPVIVALIFSWFRESEMAMAQAYIGVAAWLAAIIGYILTGQLLERTNFNITIYIGLSIAVVAIFILLIGVKNPKLAMLNEGQTTLQ